MKRIESTVERVGNGQPIILVAHDFGCMYSFKFEAKRPDLVRKFVAIDVGGAMKPSVCGAMLMVTYQVGGRYDACWQDDRQISDPVELTEARARRRNRHNVVGERMQSDAHVTRGLGLPFSISTSRNSHSTVVPRSSCLLQNVTSITALILRPMTTRTHKQP